MKLVIWVSYAEAGSPKDKAAELGMSKSKMYELRDQFMYYFMGKSDSTLPE
jgi:hypothetical protein